ncbi:zinc finger MYM-type 1-like [Paramuricea clavata]|uniref:Zinc finger MYM-type 1-like n=1 Tax=Paramuricea clavata TaxID=317549 RepID=A0A6S7GHD3_PARCT|nr:zinc finger MYM-type 1-like [Paramuricea clavata]
MDGVDSSAQTRAASLHGKVLKLDFMFALMFMHLIMEITKILTIQMQTEKLNILDALMAIEETVASLETIRRNESEMNNQVKASVEFAKSFDQDPEEDFRCKRVRRMSRQQDDNPDIAASTEFSQLPLKAEFEIFPQVVGSSQDPFKSVHEVCNLAYEHKSIFPSIFKVFKLLFTAPVCVAKDERTFSKMKIIKNSLQSTMSEERLEDLILLAAEKDLTDKVNLDKALKVWASKKNLKLKIKF